MTAGNLDIQCPGCGKHYVAAGIAGKKVKCGACGKAFVASPAPTVANRASPALTEPSLPSLDDELLGDIPAPAATSQFTLPTPARTRKFPSWHTTWGKVSWRKLLNLKAACAAIVVVSVLTFLVCLVKLPLHRSAAVAGAATMILSAPVMISGIGMIIAACAWSFGVMFKISPVKALLIVILLPLNLVYTPGMSEEDRARFAQCGELAKRGILWFFIPFMIILAVFVAQALLEIRGA